MENILFKSIFCELNPESWGDAKEISKILKQHSLQYCFRGQGNKNWKLKTAIERAVEKYRGKFPGAMWMYENQIIEKFKTRASQYIASPPDDKEVIEWLSIIQHHGGATRLLDFTESFYISAFFAFESAQENDVSVWAINEVRLSNPLYLKTGIDPQIQRSLQFPDEIIKVREFARKCVSEISVEESIVLPIMPSRLNERLAVQRGLFLFPTDITSRFEKNLCSTFDFPFDSLESENAKHLTVKDLEKAVWDLHAWPSVIKINLKNHWSREAIHDLYSMNIDSASLFPGLDGFARSLNFILQDFDAGDEDL